MNCKEALQALIETVDAERWDFRHDAPARVVFPYKSASADDLGLTAREAFDGSLDAAKALHEAVLPGWAAVAGFGKDGATAALGLETADGSAVDIEIDADISVRNPARAWLLAILKALLAQGGDAE